MEFEKSLCLSEVKDDNEQLNIAYPNNYQFYFDNIQIVGEQNFKEDYKRMFSSTKSHCFSSYVTQPSLGRNETSKNQSPLQKLNDDKNELMIDSNNSHKSKSSSIKEEEEDTPRRSFLRNNVVNEKQGSKCCLIF